MVEINQFVAVTDDPEFCLETTLLYNDTRNNAIDRDVTGPTEQVQIMFPLKNKNIN